MFPLVIIFSDLGGFPRRIVLNQMFPSPFSTKWRCWLINIHIFQSTKKSDVDIRADILMYVQCVHVYAEYIQTILIQCLLKCGYQTQEMFGVQLLFCSVLFWITWTWLLNIFFFKVCKRRRNVHLILKITDCTKSKPTAAPLTGSSLFHINILQLS